MPDRDPLRQGSSGPPPNSIWRRRAPAKEFFLLPRSRSAHIEGILLMCAAPAFLAAPTQRRDVPA